MTHSPVLKTEVSLKDEELCCQINKSAALGGLYQGFCDGKQYRQHQKMLCKFKYIMVTLKHQIHSGHNKAFISL